MDSLMYTSIYFSSSMECQLDVPTLSTLEEFSTDDKKDDRSCVSHHATKVAVF